MSGTVIIISLVILAAYGWFMYKQGYDSGTASGVYYCLVLVYKDKKITKQYIMQNLPSLTDEEFEEHFDGD